MTNENKEESISKEEHEKVKMENERIKQDLEDLRLETVTPEYLEYLSLKEKKVEKKEEKKEEPKDTSKLTPEQLIEKAVKDAEAKMDEKLRLRDEDEKKRENTRLGELVSDFAKSHTDYETYRPIMYGLSLEHPKLGLQDLYDKAKAHIKTLSGETNDKDKGKKKGNEKPRGSGSSFDPNKKYTPEEAGEDSWNEVVGSGGLQLED